MSARYSGESNDRTERTSMGDPGELAADAAHFERLAQRASIIEEAHESDLILHPTDFRWRDGEWTIDGVSARMWLDHMLMD